MPRNFKKLVKAHMLKHDVGRQAATMAVRTMAPKRTGADPGEAHPELISAAARLLQLTRGLKDALDAKAPSDELDSRLRDLAVNAESLARACVAVVVAEPEARVRAAAAAHSGRALAFLTTRLAMTDEACRESMAVATAICVLADPAEEAFEVDTVAKIAAMVREYADSLRQTLATA